MRNVTPVAGDPRCPSENALTRRLGKVLRGALQVCASEARLALVETLFHRDVLIVGLAELSLVREATAYDVLDSDERPIGWISQDVGSVGSVVSRLLPG